MTQTLERTTVLESTTCANCGVMFAMPKKMLAERREDGASFYCPNGHSLVFKATEAQRLRKQLESTQQQVQQAYGYATHERDQRQAAERSNAALRGVITKTKKRAAAGVCQCCNRTFQDVARHMANQHPNYAV